ncbi:Hsp70 family protein [Ornithinimicrobium ciconiae]|uniref:Hsp70 family protein n=1 Tax=Ornithinimicrobium ciconiae TaxID=2594265 RepID=A0A516G794_9MICO|nr:Hsp70 family protein [Ornithinimicrobium ciconiae]QDO87389.1 Hsp70 family protein [Ornithinimicrobium ciconiae]
MEGQARTGWRLAIDFGTTNTAAAVEHMGQVHPLRLSASSHLMPSAVLVTDGDIRTGSAATRGAAIHPAGYEPTPKRRLIEEQILLDGDLIQPVKLVAAILRKVYEHALADADQVPPTEVVLTHPQAWHAHRIGLLRAAAEQADIPADRLRLVSEPLATAWYYSAGDPLPAGAYLAVLDLGGGTSDAALLRYVVEAGTGRYEVVDSDGIDPLGGHDFDSRLETWAQNQMCQDGPPDLLAELEHPRQTRARLTLREDVRAAKESLSENQSETIGVMAGTQEWVGVVTRNEYEELVAVDIDRAVGLVLNLLRDLPGAPEVHRLYLTGGSSMTPLLQRRLEEVLPGRIGTRGDRKQVTALGALHVPAVSAPRPPAPLPPPVPHSTDSGPAQHTVPSQPTDGGQPTGPNHEAHAGAGRNTTRTVMAVGGVVAAVAATVAAFLTLGSDDSEPNSPGDTPTSGAPRSDAVIATAADMERLIADHQLALRSSCVEVDLADLPQDDGEVVVLECSDPLTDSPAMLHLSSFASVADTAAAFDSQIQVFDDQGALPLSERASWGDGVSQGHESSSAATFSWTDESTMTLSVLASADLSAADLYVHWLDYPDYSP